ncbi:MAG: acetyltransferase [Gammaproteobacteria bacterium]|nr:acetyltransferase [Gammaproteobacteria bacterium]MBU1978440.1 acetyltransferase [Gammaproteobacteria bacterium]
MTHYDVFNGDADGICALHQLRLAYPRDSQLITGVKRDITLLERVVAKPGDRVTVFDISLDKNREALLTLLDGGARVVYFDHHFPGDIPAHLGFDAHIDRAPDICTSLLVDRFLQAQYRIWAVVGAFGDNLHKAARRAAEPLLLNADQLDALQSLGECLNYNGYGETLADLHFPPDELYRLLHGYTDPFAFIAEAPALQQLQQGYAEDMAKAGALQPEMVTETCALYILPDEAWSRRVSGSFGNRLAQSWPNRAHAILTRRSNGYTVSVRAPLTAPTGADDLCRRFDSGGGRKAAAGINCLPESKVVEFVEEFRAAWC